MWLACLTHDLKLAVRGLRRAPGFTAAAVIALGLALGANLAVFTVVNSVLLEPLPYPASGQLVALRQWAPGAGGVASAKDGLGLSISMYLTYAEHNRSFSAMGVWDTPGGITITGVGRPERVRAVELSYGALEALAVPPLQGRWFEPSDENPQGAATVILSYGYWQQKFGGGRRVLGRQLRVNGTPRTIVGVMPQGYRVAENEGDVYLPLQTEHTGLKLAGFGLNGVARLRPGVTLAAANRDLQGLIEVWMNSWTNGPSSDPHFYRRWRITPDVEPLKSSVIGGVRAVLWAILATVGVVMLVAAGNILNLFLLRAEARQQELAVRAALGAGRARMAHSLMMESGLVAIAGLGLGWVLAAVALAWLRTHGPGNLPRLEDVELGWRTGVLGAALAASVALLTGLLPAWRTMPAVKEALGGDGHGASTSRERRRARNLLAMAQMALALVLVVAAGLLLRSMAALQAVRVGVANPATLQYFRLSLRGTRSDAAVMQEQQEILRRLAAIPGVSAVGMADQLPMQYSPGWDIVVRRGDTWNSQASPPARAFYFVTPGYFATVGTRLLAGRDFSWEDVYGLRPYAVISGNLARDFWGSPAAAVGKELSPSGPGNWKQVIGVVADVRSNGVGEPPPETVYWPLLNGNLWGTGTVAFHVATVVLRTPRAGSAGLLTDMQTAVSKADPDLPVYTVGTMAGLERDKLAVPDFTMVMLTLAGGMALALGVVGLYGVIAYDVETRRREVGIRMALGASRGSVLSLFLGQGLQLAAVGAAVGLVGAALLTRALASLLYGVTPLDPATFIAAPLLLLLTVALACYFPARRASGMEAARILRR